MLSGKNIAFYVALALFIAALVAGIILTIKSSGSGSPGIEILLPTETPTPELRVHMSGAVAVPGVYALKEGDRLVDAIDAAGGAREGAQLSCINLAARVEDEDHFHVPGPAEPCEGTPSVTTGEEDAGINLNTATVELLQTLPNIGEARARAITAFRENNGPFESVEEIVGVPGIGPAIYESIRDLVHVGPATQLGPGTQ